MAIAGDARTTTPSGTRDPTRGAGDLLKGVQAFLRARGRAEDAASVTRPLLAQQSGVETSVVVVGEVGRGKSTLVNALLRDPDASPTGSGETTAVYLRFPRPDDGHPAGTAVLKYPDRDDREVDRSEMHRWITVEGLLLPADDEPVPLGAELYLPGGMLPEVVLVDTPGTSGLNEAHAQAAFDAAAGASVLVLVTGAGTRLTRPELEFLQRCAAQVYSVVVVVNKIDGLGDRWLPVLEEDRELVARLQVGMVDVVAVSARQGVEAAARAGTPIGERFLEQSRLAELVAALRRQVAQADRLPALNALRRGQALLRTERERLVGERRVLQGDVTYAPHLDAVATALDQRIAALGSALSPWDEQWGQLQLDLKGVVRSIETEFSDALEGEINKGFVLSRQRVAVLRNEIRTRFETSCTRMYRQLVERCTAVVRSLYEESGLPFPPRIVDLIESVVVSGPERETPRADRASPVIGAASQTVGVLRGLVYGLNPGVLKGLQAGGVMAASAVLSWTFLPLTAGVGVIAIAGGMGKASKTALLADLGRMRGDLSFLLNRMVEQESLVVRTKVLPQLRKDLTDAKNGVMKQRAVLERSRTASKQQRADEIEVLDKQIRDCDAWLTKLGAEMARLSAAPR